MVTPSPLQESAMRTAYGAVPPSGGFTVIVAGPLPDRKASTPFAPGSVSAASGGFSMTPFVGSCGWSLITTRHFVVSGAVTDSGSSVTPVTVWLTGEPQVPTWTGPTVTGPDPAQRT